MFIYMLHTMMKSVWLNVFNLMTEVPKSEPSRENDKDKIRINIKERGGKKKERNYCLFR